MNQILKQLSRPQIQMYQVISFFFILALFFNGCKENPGGLSLGEEFIESQTNLTLIDTFTVSLSTVILDSVTTSGTEIMLIGIYSDNTFGKIKCSSYLQIGNPATYSVENNDTYDSLYLVIKYNKYFFGDTTMPQKISVHQLTENIRLNEDDVVTGNTTFSYNTQPIGTIVYTPEPNNSTDTLAIKLSNDTGFDLFSKLKEASDIILGSESFINYFHGLVLLPDDSNDKSVIGFGAAEENVKLILFTSRKEEDVETITYEFHLENTGKQFNNITHDFTSTQLNNLVKQRDEMPDSKTGGLSFLQGGLELAIRVDFPYLQDIMLLTRGKIGQAQLSIAPLSGSYNDISLPEELYIYGTGKLNMINSTGVASSTLMLDELYHEQTAYMFDITNYLNEELADSYVDPENGLLITLSTNDRNATLKRLVGDTKNKNTRLKIYYLSY